MNRKEGDRKKLHFFCYSKLLWDVLRFYVMQIWGQLCLLIRSRPFVMCSWWDFSLIFSFIINYFIRFIKFKYYSDLCSFFWLFCFLWKNKNTTAHWSPRTTMSRVDYQGLWTNVRQILRQVIGLKKGPTISIYLFSRCKEEYRLAQFQI